MLSLNVCTTFHLLPCGAQQQTARSVLLRTGRQLKQAMKDAVGDGLEH